MNGRREQIYVMIDKELERYVKEFNERISAIDPLASTILKCHFLIEEQLNGVLEAVAKAPKYLDLDRSMFAQKVKWARVFAPLGDNILWSLILAINTLRNNVAHTPEGPGRKNAI